MTPSRLEHRLAGLIVFLVPWSASFHSYDFGYWFFQWSFFMREGSLGLRVMTGLFAFNCCFIAMQAARWTVRNMLALDADQLAALIKRRNP